MRGVRRAGSLFDRIVSFESLCRAARRAALGTRTKVPVARFLQDLEPEVLALRRELEDGTWRPSPARTFLLTDPKPRRIAAVSFRDRVVHHTLMAEVGPVLDATLVFDSYACREGKGGHRAVLRAQRFARGTRDGYLLRTDVEHFFETVDHDVVLGLVRRKIKDARTLVLLERIVRVPVEGSAPGKGLPIGSLTSQHLANFTLGALDHLAKERLGLRRYVRYMDDVVVFSGRKEALHEALAAMRGFVEEELLLRLKESATRITPVADGFPFLGFRVFPGSVRLGRVARLRFTRRLRAKERACREGRMDEATLAAEAQSLVAHVAAAGTLAFRRSLFGSGSLSLSPRGEGSG